MDYRYIVVEGSIGSGKSEVSQRLAGYFNALYLTESPERNPFLEQFYLNAANHGLATELYFLMRRAEAVEVINTEEEKNGRIVPDFRAHRAQRRRPGQRANTVLGNEAQSDARISRARFGGVSANFRRIGAKAPAKAQRRHVEFVSRRLSATNPR